MANELSNVSSDLLLNWLLRTDQAVTRPLVIYCGLATAALSDTTTLATVTQPTDASYVRQAVHSNTGTPAKFAAPADAGGIQKIKNNAAITFPFATGGQQITHCFLTDSASGTTGNILSYATLPVAQTPSAGDQLEFAANSMEVGIE